ncbi:MULTISPECIES: WXG100 family type VII secretion target [unclassified Streptomyces]|jgi:early secretory antigenic target protein ESAT-6|uniref:WXG100 family type VII secretion target n=1 Tax=unclassified Streptomyces TaxID=2593676 RepID=UPI001BE6A17F|nr:MULTISPECIES: WXG100 family type VII secretion target [unclassified Streptomyces]MBT2395198.1 WXG100 family type VII secretion target [Streptomyces sp. ISL-100]MBT2491156.1 WXG100 family type VII secretion target [Streptomyces sp. ISL-96]
MSILVNYATITNASTDVKNTAGRIKQQLDDVEAAVRRVATTWEGEAQEGYQRKQRDWDKTAAALHATLMKIAAALQNSAENYQATEKSNANTWG